MVSTFAEEEYPEVDREFVAAMADASRQGEPWRTRLRTVAKLVRRSFALHHLVQTHL